MKEELTTFETAKLAKEKGFNIETLHFYTKSNSKMFGIDEKGRSYPIKNTSKKLYRCGDYAALNIENVYSAPTQSLLQKWLREEHGILVWASPDYDFSNETILHNQWTGTTTKGLFAGTIEHLHHTTYESALEIALREGLILI